MLSTDTIEAIVRTSINAVDPKKLINDEEHDKYENEVNALTAVIIAHPRDPRGMPFEEVKRVFEQSFGNMDNDAAQEIASSINRVLKPRITQPANIHPHR